MHGDEIYREAVVRLDALEEVAAQAAHLLDTIDDGGGVAAAARALDSSLRRLSEISYTDRVVVLHALDHGALFDDIAETTGLHPTRDGCEIWRMLGHMITYRFCVHRAGEPDQLVIRYHPESGTAI